MSEQNSRYNQKDIIARFKEINRGRLERAYSAVKPSQRLFLELIPLLFHVNHPLLPGYGKKDTPMGILGYRPAKDLILKAANSYSRNFQYQQPRTSAIKAIYAMGSVGSIAHGSASDFDLWLCHDPNLSIGELKLLQEKATALEQAAEKLMIELHFFLVNDATFRSGEMSELSSESSGTAQRHLLLDEFYRTSILIEGQFPAWWVIPPDEEAHYEYLLEDARNKRFFYVNHIIDFGSIATIQAEEFFGASLWQFSKAISSPYKSMIKLLLIESYINQYPNIQLLSHQFKQAVYAGETDLDKLDPYRNLIVHLDNYLAEMDDRSRMELVRKAFYFKVNIPLSDENIKAGWRVEMLRQIIADWNWNSSHFHSMDQHQFWNIQQVVAERQILFEALSNSYRSLSQAVHSFGRKSMISEEDLTILGRKLFASYERKAGKIEIISRGIGNNLSEARVSIHDVKDREGKSIWHVYPDYVNENQRQVEQSLKQALSLVELLAWCYFNGILTKNTSVAIFSTNPVIDQVTLQKIIDRLFAQFPLDQMEKSSVDDFNRPSRLLRNQFFINVGVEIAGGFDPQKYKTEGRASEPLSYGFKKECLLQRFDFVFSTSWGEIMSNRYLREDGLAEAICHYFKWFPCNGTAIPENPQFMAMGMSRGTSITYRMNELFTVLINYFYADDDTSNHRFILAIGSYWYILFFGQDQLLKFRKIVDYSQMTQLLGQHSPTFTTTRIDQHTLNDRPLSQIYKLNSEGVIQFFYLPRRNVADIYVLDERGILFHQVMELHDELMLVNQFNNFFESVINRIAFLTQDSMSQSVPRGIEYYRVIKDKMNQFTVTKVTLPKSAKVRKFFSLQVIVDMDENQKTMFNLYCEGREFSSLQYGNTLFKEVVDHILTKRSSKEAYPIYITDISVSSDVVGQDGNTKVQTVLFLKYKERIESRLNAVMERAAKMLSQQQPAELL